MHKRLSFEHPFNVQRSDYKILTVTYYAGQFCLSFVSSFLILLLLLLPLSFLSC